ncbi:MAG: hypothetical protein NUV91_08320 [Candidatus Omnitrophica bacterium]|nr:hypothetical protein [Candidatus Omnitrophota bacterium]
MKHGWLILLVFLGGCATVPPVLEDPPAPTQTETPSEGVRRFISLQQIHDGMSQDEVGNALGKQVVIGYELENEQEKRYRPLTVNNPYRTEKIQKGLRSYHVDYYLVGIQAQDDQVSDDELIPLVFENGRLIGQGWEFLESVKGR